MKLTKDTRLKDLQAAYPWLIDEAARIDRRVAALRSPLGRLLIAKADMAEASRRTGVDTDTIIASIEEMIRRHEGTP